MTAILQNISRYYYYKNKSGSHACWCL